MPPDASVPTLRDYQELAVVGARNRYRQGHRSVLLVGPTGCGKTTIFSYIISSAEKKRRRSLVLAHRTELISQASQRLDLYGINHGIIQGQHERTNLDLSIQVGSIQTLIRRQLPPFDFIVVDEAHHGTAPSYLGLLERFPAAKVLGVTATPFRANGKGLGSVFTALETIASVQELIDRGFLVPARMFAPSAPDLTGLRTRAGDYEQEELARRADQRTLIGDIVKHWLRLAAGRPTICFAVNVQHSLHIVDQFRAAGVRARHLDANTDPEERAGMIRELGLGKIDIISNVGVLTEGTDIPEVACILLARPTKSLGLYIQMVGRGLRTADGKTACLVLDHGANCLLHGSVAADRDYDLENGIKKKKRSDDSPANAIRQCRTCYAIIRASIRICPECGDHQQTHSSFAVKHKEGELVEVDFTKVKERRKQRVAEAETLAELQELQKEFGYKHGWAWNIYQYRQRKNARRGGQR